MRKTIPCKSWIISLLLIPVIARSEPPALHWVDCFQAAMKKSETVADQDELISQANEKRKQVMGGALPSVAAAATHSNLSVPTTAYQPIQNTVQLTAVQPIFRGFRDYSGLKQASATIAATEQTKKRVLVQLYQAVVTAFFQVLAAEKDIDDLQSEEKLYQKQIEQLQAWLKIGRSRSADVMQTQSQRAQLLATLTASKDQLNTARETLAYLTGLNKDVVIEDSFPPHFDASLEPLANYVDAIDRRPEVMAATLNRDAADEGITIANGAHLPSVNLLGDYYPVRTGVSPVGSGSGSWDVALSLTFPIFSGGVTQSQVRVAASQYRENELFVSQDKRLADQEIRTYFKRVQNDEERVKSLVIAKNLAWTSYQQELRDSRQSMASNIDVLQSLTTFTTTERTLDQVRFQKRIDYLYLHAAAGKTKDIP